MGNGYTTSLRYQYHLESNLETHTGEIPVPTVLGLVVMGSIIISIIELWRSFK